MIWPEPPILMKTPCPRCHSRKRKQAPKRKICVFCLAKEKEWNNSDAKREANRRYHHGTRRKRTGSITKEEIHAGYEKVRRERIRMIVDWAREEGGLPTVEEVGEMFGIVKTSVTSQQLRREAFGLKKGAMSNASPRRARAGRIPYPVPSEYLED